MATHPFILHVAGNPDLAQKSRSFYYLWRILARVLDVQQGVEDITVGAETHVALQLVRLEMSLGLELGDHAVGAHVTAEQA